MRCLFIGALLLATVGAHADGLASHKAGSFLQVSLNDVHPTQTVIGYDQIYSKLGSFAANPGKAFDEYCESNGQGESSSVPQGATLQDSTSFQCDSPVGSHLKDMKTVIIGPGDRLYLTDGHHSFTTLWEQPGGGPALKMWVKIDADYSDSPSPEAFWQRMQAAHKTWLKDGNGQSIQPAQLPEHLGLHNLQDDPYRSLAYFVRGAAFDKPQSTAVVPEFLEFYWGDWLRQQVPPGTLNLTTLEGYSAALQTVSQRMVAAQPDAPIDNGFTASQLGGLQTLNQKELNKIIKKKVVIALHYKAEHPGS